MTLFCLQHLLSVQLYAEESLSIIKKQRDTIEKLQTENDVRQSLFVRRFRLSHKFFNRISRRRLIWRSALLERRTSQILSSSRSTIRVRGCHYSAWLGRRALTLHFPPFPFTVKMYKEKLSVEKKNAEQLYKQVKKLRTLISEKRRNMGGVNAAKENHAMIQKQIRILENRLDKALIKFNEALAFNRELRQEIDNLRQERVVSQIRSSTLTFVLTKHSCLVLPILLCIHSRSSITSIGNWKRIYSRGNKIWCVWCTGLKLLVSYCCLFCGQAEVIERSNKAYETRDRAQIETVQIQTALTKRRAEHDKILEDLER